MNARGRRRCRRRTTATLGSSTTWRQKITCGPARRCICDRSHRAIKAVGTSMPGHLQYFSRRWLINGQTENVDPNYIAEAGYVPRNGYHRALGTIGYTFLPEGGRVLSHGPTLTSSNFFDWTGKLSDYETALGYTVTLRSGDVFSTSGGADYVRLLQPFDPTNSGREQLQTGSVHRWKFWSTKFDSRQQSVLRYGFSSTGGRLLCRRDTAERLRHDRVPVSAVGQPVRHRDLQRSPAAAAVGTHAASGWSARDSTSR